MKILTLSLPLAREVYASWVGIQYSRFGTGIEDNHYKFAGFGSNPFRSVTNWIFESPRKSVAGCLCVRRGQREREIARTAQNENKAGTFFLATLVLWFVSVWFEIVFNKRQELLWVIAGCCFFQTANWVIRFCLSRDPLFVNTSVSLLHSSITSVSGSFISNHSHSLCFLFWVLFHILNWVFSWWYYQC